MVNGKKEGTEKEQNDRQMVFLQKTNLHQNWTVPLSILLLQRLAGVTQQGDWIAPCVGQDEHPCSQLRKSPWKATFLRASWKVDLN